MIQRFRLVHFQAHPILGPTFPIGALLERGSVTEFVEAPHLPGEGCLGGHGRMIALQAVLRVLRTNTHFDVRPPAPTVRVGDVVEFAETIEEPLACVKKILEGGTAPVMAIDAEGADSYREARRSAFGKQFFKQYEIDRYVRPLFKPGESIPGLLEEARDLPAISQWVGGRGQLLLLEAIVPGRRQFEEDLCEVKTRFAAYRYTLAHAKPTGVTVELVALVLQGSKERRDTATARLAEYAHRVADVTVNQSRRQLIEQVRKIGIESDATGTLGEP